MPCARQYAILSQHQNHLSVSVLVMLRIGSLQTTCLLWPADYLLGFNNTCRRQQGQRRKRRLATSCRLSVGSFWTESPWDHQSSSTSAQQQQGLLITAAEIQLEVFNACIMPSSKTLASATRCPLSRDLCF